MKAVRVLTVNDGCKVVALRVGAIEISRVDDPRIEGYTSTNAPDPVRYPHFVISSDTDWDHQMDAAEFARFVDLLRALAS